jgi:iron complex transport system permease protein
MACERAAPRRLWPALALLALALAALCALSLASGALQLDMARLWQGLTGQAGADALLARELIFNVRLPRTLLALVVGVHFALSGLILQTVIRNPLADPGVVGVSGGASLFVTGFILLLDFFKADALRLGLSLSLDMLPFAAFAGGVATAGLLLALSWRGQVQPMRMALYGVALGAILNAAAMWIVVGWGGGRTETTMLWLAGSLYGRDMEHVRAVLPWLLCGTLALLCMLRPLAMLRFPDDVGRSLGLAVRFWRLAAVLLAVGLAASAVAVTGPVGFVGLVVPHLARQLVGSSLPRLVPATALCGACLMVAADLVGRVAAAPLELPAGAVTTLLGIPLFLALLMRADWNLK